MRNRDVPVEPPEAEFPPWLKSHSHIWSEPSIDPNWHRDDACPFEPNGYLDDAWPAVGCDQAISPAHAAAWVMRLGKYKGLTLGQIKARKGGPSYLRWLSKQDGLSRIDGIVAELIDVVLMDEPRPSAESVRDSQESAEIRRLRKALVLARQENDRIGGRAVAQLSSENARLRSGIADRDEKIQGACPC